MLQYAWALYLANILFFTQDWNDDWQAGLLLEEVLGDQLPTVHWQGK